MTQGQFESVSAETLATASPALNAEAVSAEALATAPSDLQALAVFIEVLGVQPVDLVVATVFAEALVPSLLQSSNVYDSLGIMHEVFQWTGSALVPVTMSP